MKPSPRYNTYQPNQPLGATSAILDLASFFKGGLSTLGRLMITFFCI